MTNEETMRDVFNRFYGRYPKDYQELTAFVFDMAVKGLAFTKYSPKALIKKYGE